MSQAPMDRALRLAHSVRGKTSPNPPVGAVLLRDGECVGEGATQPVGQAHAELICLRMAGEQAHGATLYVTLEPCSHWGRTPPCADALIAAGIAEAHIACIDPNPLVAGAGIARLRAHRIEVSIGEGSVEAAEVMAEYLVFMRSARPFLTLTTGADLSTLPPDVTESDVIVVAAGQRSFAPRHGCMYAASIPDSMCAGPISLQRVGHHPEANCRDLAEQQHFESYNDMLTAFGQRGITSCLIAVDRLEEHPLLVAANRLLLPSGCPPPAGFVTPRTSSASSTCRIFDRVQPEGWNRCLPE